MFNIIKKKMAVKSAITRYRNSTNVMTPSNYCWCEQ